MATCGNCKKTDQSIEHVRECYSATGTTVLTAEATGFAKTYLEKRDFAPMAVAAQEVPDSRYALQTEDGPVFYQVRTGKKGTRWEGFQFVDRLIGHPGTFLKTPVKGANRKAVLSLLAQDPKEAAVRFSREYTICAVCGSELSDLVSIEMGLGPKCAERF